MLRLVDVEGALRLLALTTDEPLVLEVSDDVIEGNTGEYTVGRGEVVRAAEAEMRVSLDVRDSRNSTPGTSLPASSRGTASSSRARRRRWRL
jgi:hypothetical protein